LIPTQNAKQSHFFSSKHIMIVQKLPKQHLLAIIRFVQHRKLKKNEPKGTRSVKAIRQVAFPEDISRKRRTKLSFSLLLAKRIRLPEDAVRSKCPR
jgi:hypothetical protein